MFKWKVKRPIVSKLQGTWSDEDQDEGAVDELYNGQPAKRARPLEDPVIKFRRLKNEGSTLASEERYSGALNKFDEALSTISVITPSESTLALQCLHTDPAYYCQPVGLSDTHVSFHICVTYEMKAQALLALDLLFPAIQAAENAVGICPTWDEAWQTLGRAQLNYGDLRLGLLSIQKAIHLNPMNLTALNDDLPWAEDLWRREKEMLSRKENICTCQSVHADLHTNSCIRTGAGKISNEIEHGVKEETKSVLVKDNVVDLTPDQINKWNL